MNTILKNAHVHFPSHQKGLSDMKQIYGINVLGYSLFSLLSSHHTMSFVFFSKRIMLPYRIRFPILSAFQKQCEANLITLVHARERERTFSNATSIFASLVCASAFLIKKTGIGLFKNFCKAFKNICFFF